MYEIGHNRFERHLFEHYYAGLEVMVSQSHMVSFVRLSVWVNPRIEEIYADRDELKRIQKELYHCALGIHDRYNHQFTYNALHSVRKYRFEILFDNVDHAQYLYDRVEQEFVLEKLKNI